MRCKISDETIVWQKRDSLLLKQHSQKWWCELQTTLAKPRKWDSKCLEQDLSMRRGLSRRILICVIDMTQKESLHSFPSYTWKTNDKLSNGYVYVPPPPSKRETGYPRLVIWIQWCTTANYKCAFETSTIFNDVENVFEILRKRPPQKLNTMTTDVAQRSKAGNYGNTH